MEYSPLAEIDGKLYCQNAARGSQVHYIESKITSVTATDITYIDYVHDFSCGDAEEAETVAHEFHYSKTDDGWRWTVFYCYM